VRSATVLSSRSFIASSARRWSSSLCTSLRSVCDSKWASRKPPTSGMSGARAVVSLASTMPAIAPLSSSIGRLRRQRASSAAAAASTTPSTTLSCRIWRSSAWSPAIALASGWRTSTDQRSVVIAPSRPVCE
jgi:hypothetical protein